MTPCDPGFRRGPAGTRVYLVRHGATSFNQEHRWQGHLDVSMTDEGRRQAEELALTLPPVAALYSSDLRRARETAAILAPATGLVPVHDPVWREFDVGRWSGLTRDEIRERDPETWNRIRSGEDLPRGGGETMADAGTRVRAALDQVAARHPGQSVAVVTHGGVIRIAICLASGRPLSELAAVAVPPNASVHELSLPLELSPGSG